MDNSDSSPPRPAAAKRSTQRARHAMRKLCARIGGFVFAHRLVWMVALLGTISTQPLAAKLFQSLIRHNF